MIAVVRSVRRATPRTRLVQLELDGPFAFRAGQAVIAGRPGESTRAAYSVASPPSSGARGTIELLVGAEGAFGEPLGDPSALTGVAMAIDGPLGSFGVPPEAGRVPLLLAAGGTGIAPIRAVILNQLEQPDPAPLTVIYSARSADEFAFGDELEALARGRRLELHCTVTRDEPTGWPGRTGRIDDGLLAAVAPGPAAWCLVCGPAPFVNDVAAALLRQGVDPAHIVVER